MCFCIKIFIGSLSFLEKDFRSLLTPTYPSLSFRYMTFMSMGAWYHQSYELAIFTTAISTFLGWPFAAAIGWAMFVVSVCFLLYISHIFVMYCKPTLCTWFMYIYYIWRERKGQRNGEKDRQKYLFCLSCFFLSLIPSFSFPLLLFHHEFFFFHRIPIAYDIVFRKQQIFMFVKWCIISMVTILVSEYMFAVGLTVEFQVLLV